MICDGVKEDIDQIEEPGVDEGLDSIVPLSRPGSAAGVPLDERGAETVWVGVVEQVEERYARVLNGVTPEAVVEVQDRHAATEEAWH